MNLRKETNKVEEWGQRILFFSSSSSFSHFARSFESQILSFLFTLGVLPFVLLSSRAKNESKWRECNLPLVSLHLVCRAEVWCRILKQGLSVPLESFSQTAKFCMSYHYVARFHDGLF